MTAARLNLKKLKFLSEHLGELMEALGYATPSLSLGTADEIVALLAGLYEADNDRPPSFLTGVPPRHSLLPSWFLDEMEKASEAAERAGGPGQRQSAQARIVTDLLLDDHLFRNLLEHVVSSQERQETALLQTEAELESWGNNKRIHLRYNRFNAWLAAQPFVTKLSHDAAGPPDADGCYKALNDVRLLGRMCICDFSTEDIKEFTLAHLRAKYKRNRLSSAFIDLFEECRTSERHCGQVALVFGDIIKMFGLDECQEHIGAIEGEGSRVRRLATEEFVEYLHEQFLQGVNSRYKLSCFIPGELTHAPLLRRLAFLYWQRKLRKKLIEQEAAPDEAKAKPVPARTLARHPAQHRENIDARSMAILKQMVASKAGLFMTLDIPQEEGRQQQGVALGMDGSGLLVACRTDLALPDGKAVAVSCRFCSRGLNDKTTFYSFETSILSSREVQAGKSVLVLAFPQAIAAKQRKSLRYSANPGDVEALHVWEAGRLGMDRQEPGTWGDPLMSLFHGAGILSVSDISSGGLRLAVAQRFLDANPVPLATGQLLTLRMVLRERKKDRIIAAHLTAAIRSVVPDKDGTCIMLGLQFLQEANLWPSGRLNWSELQESGSTVIGHWVAMRFLGASKVRQRI